MPLSQPKIQYFISEPEELLDLASHPEDKAREDFTLTMELAEVRVLVGIVPAKVDGM